MDLSWNYFAVQKKNELNQKQDKSGISENKFVYNLPRRLACVHVHVYVSPKVHEFLLVYIIGAYL